MVEAENVGTNNKSAMQDGNLPHSCFVRFRQVPVAETVELEESVVLVFLECLQLLELRKPVYAQAFDLYESFRQCSELKKFSPRNFRRPKTSCLVTNWSSFHASFQLSLLLPYLSAQLQWDLHQNPFSKTKKCVADILILL